MIEDDPRMQKVLRRIFSEEQYAIAVAGDGQTGLNLFRSQRPVAVVLDLILPNISGASSASHSRAFQTTLRLWC